MWWGMATVGILTVGTVMGRFILLMGTDFVVWDLSRGWLGGSGLVGVVDRSRLRPLMPFGKV
jgi:hypothetical protein